MSTGINTSCFLLWHDAGGIEHTIFFNAVTSQTQEHSSEITRHPVEDGGDISDHVQQSPDRVTIEGVVSEEPITDDDNFGGNKNGGETVFVRLDVPTWDPPLQPTPGSLFQAAGNAVRNLLLGAPEYGAQVLRFGKEFGAVLEVHNALVDLKESAQLMTVYTSTRAYEDMVITNVTVGKTPAEGTSGKFSITLEKIRKVLVGITDAPKPTELRATPPKAKGTQAPAPTPAPTKKSALKQLQDKLTGKSQNLEQLTQAGDVF